MPPADLLLLPSPLPIRSRSYSLSFPLLPSPSLRLLRSSASGPFHPNLGTPNLRRPLPPPPPLPFLSAASSPVPSNPIVDSFLLFNNQTVDSETKTDAVEVKSFRKIGEEVVIEGEVYRADRAADPDERVGFTMTFSDPASNKSGPSGTSLDFSVTLSQPLASPLFNRIYLAASSPPNEKIHGMGVQYTSVDHKGKIIPVIVSEQGIGRGLQVRRRAPSTAGGGVARAAFASAAFGSGGGERTCSNGLERFFDRTPFLFAGGGSSVCRPFHSISC